MMHGAIFLASLNKSLILDAPTPTKTSTNSDPDFEMKDTSASPAVARASKVLPVPGGPSSSTPLGMIAPASLYLAGFFKKSTTSCSSNFASSHPATSENIVLAIGS